MTSYVKIRGWRQGVVNIAAPDDIARDALFNAVNLDIRDGGDVVRRPGYQRVYTGAISKHTLWTWQGSPELPPITLFIEGGSLKRLKDDYTAETLATGVGGGPAAYTAAPPGIVYSTPTATGILARHGREWARIPWGVPGPAHQPALTTGTGGQLAEGTYQVAVTFADPWGQESGTVEAVETAVVSGGSILLTGIPQPADSTHAIRVYAGNAGAEHLYHVADFPAGVTTWDIRSLANTEDYALQTQFAIVPPPAALLAYRFGRVWFAIGAELFATLPMQYGLFRPDEDAFAFDEPIAVLLAVPDGLYIVAERTYFLSGTDSDLRQVPGLPTGAVRHSGIHHPDSNNVAWFTERGLAVAGPGGQVELDDDRVAVASFEQGALGYIEHDGVRKYVFTGQNGTASPYADPDYAAAEIARKGDAL